MNQLNARYSDRAWVVGEEWIGLDWIGFDQLVERERGRAFNFQISYFHSCHSFQTLVRASAVQCISILCGIEFTSKSEKGAGSLLVAALARAGAPVGTGMCQ